MKPKLVYAALVAAGLSAAGWKLSAPRGLDTFMPVPDENPLTAEKVALGQELFFDKRLSRDQSLACANCHDPTHAFTDTQPVAIGVFQRRGQRRAPSLLNRGYGASFFWDGRIRTLEEQVLQPIVNPLEMDLPIEEAVARFRPQVNSVEELSHALASYVRTILSGDSPFDRYVAGDAAALSPLQLEGLRLFRGKANCTACHIGPNLTDELFHNTGIGYRDATFADSGRFTVTRDPKHLGAFKTPTLRAVADRPPYMHDGSLATLEDVIEHYDKGGIPNPNLDEDIEPLNLNPPEKRALTAFLQALSGTIVHGIPPQSPTASTLRKDGNRALRQRQTVVPGVPQLLSQRPLDREAVRKAHRGRWWRTD
jgi:cytochrome c peroxidase